MQLSPLLSACNCLKMPKFVVILGALAGSRGAGVARGAASPYKPSLPAPGRCGSGELGSVPMSQRRNPEPWDSEFIGKEAAERGSSIQSGTISSLCWHTAAFHLPGGEVLAV